MSSEPRQPSEEQLREAYEEEIKRLRVEHILLDNVAALANLGMRRTGMAPGTESERDPEQVRLAIESIRALLPVLEQTAPSQIGAIRDAVSQLQIAFVKIGGRGATAGAAEAAAGAGAAGAGAAEPSQPAGEGASSEPERPKPGEPGPAQRSGRLWVPGQ
ncbi:MAG: hypothetical protein JO262_03335 [Solirubrobacterales bacterium]|nr:hypothetical protein [Solirubrobacterales bacterium]